MVVATDFSAAPLGRGQPAPDGRGVVIRLVECRPERPRFSLSGRARMATFACIVTLVIQHMPVGVAAVGYAA